MAHSFRSVVLLPTRTNSPKSKATTTTTVRSEVGEKKWPRSLVQLLRAPVGGGQSCISGGGERSKNKTKSQKIKIKTGKHQRKEKWKNNKKRPTWEQKRFLHTHSLTRSPGVVLAPCRGPCQHGTRHGLQQLYSKRSIIPPSTSTSTSPSPPCTTTNNNHPIPTVSPPPTYVGALIFSPVSSRRPDAIDWVGKKGKSVGASHLATHKRLRVARKTTGWRRKARPADWPQPDLVPIPEAELFIIL